jgi:ATP-dependent RNA helicase DDX10/DBP4
MIFSATLSKDIHHLSHVSMQQPEMIILNQQKSDEAGIYDTPATLKQSYMMTNSDEKIDVLFSFLKSHIHDKVLVFFASCKEVRFVYEAFRKLRIGTPIFELHGR